MTKPIISYHPKSFNSAEFIKDFKEFCNKHGVNHFQPRAYGDEDEVEPSLCFRGVCPKTNQYYFIKFKDPDQKEIQVEDL